MFRAAFLAILLLPVLPAAFAQTGQQSYTGQLLKLTILTDDQKHRDAIEGYRLLEAQPGTPGWLKAACQYQIAESHLALRETQSAFTALGEAVRLGFDDCVAPSASEPRAFFERLQAMQALEGIKITNSDFRELVWLKAEVQHVRHDGNMMVIENTNRLDHEATVVPQSQVPARPTTSAGVLYWRQLLLVRQVMQREFVMRADVLRIRHATNMAIISGVSTTAALESARRARTAAESRRLEIRSRAFVPAPPLLDRPKTCSEWSLDLTGRAR